MNTSSWGMKIQRQHVAAGLTWMPLIGTRSREVRNELRQQLKSHRSQHGLLHLAKDARFALGGLVRSQGKQGTGKLGGKKSVALWFAASSDAPTVYVQRLEQGTWVLIRSGGNLDPRSDQLHSPEEAEDLVREVLSSMLAMNQMPELVFGPNTPMTDLERWSSVLSIRNASIDALLAGKPPSSSIKKLLGIPAWLPVLIVLILAGWTAKQLFDKALQLREARAARAALQVQDQSNSADQMIEQQRASKALGQAAVKALESDSATASPHDFITACAHGLRRLPARLGGWKRKSVTCTLAGDLQANYVLDTELRGGLATENSFKTAAAGLGLDAQVGWFRTEGTISRSLPVEQITPRSPLTLDELPSAATVGELYSSLNQRIGKVLPGSNVRIDEPRPREIDPVDGKPVTPAYQNAQLTASGSGIWLMREALPNRPEVTIKTIEIDTMNAPTRWLVQGSVVVAN